jgi:hypothetical protein
MASKNTTLIASLILENVAPVGNILYDGWLLGRELDDCEALDLWLADGSVAR